MPAPKTTVPSQEKWIHRCTFETYLMLGPARSLKRLAQESGISYATVAQWKKKFDWDTKLDIRDRKLMTQVMKDNDKEYIENVKKRHQLAYQELQAKSLDYIMRHSRFEDTKDAAIALDISIKGERDVLGLRDTKLKGAIMTEGFAALIEATCGSNG